jgi:sterol desaturase/sphingolipid hydroxylase (fatty acid hydroxylase superfamily)
MDYSRETILLWTSLPIYVLVIGGEMIYSHFGNKKLYSVKGFFTNLYLTILNFSLDALMRFVGVWLMLNYFCDLGGFKLYENLNPIVYWVSLTILEDFMYYLEHLLDHTSRFFWAIHVTHHSSEEYNLSVGFRSSVFQPLYRFIFFLPLAFIGFRAEDIMFTYAWTQIWGVLVHTQSVKKLWWPIENIFTTPSHHRVHHASNVRYLDRNMGMFLIVWDKMFGTYADEDSNYQPIKYGLTSNLSKVDPVNVVFHEWKNIFHDMKKSPKLKVKLMYIFGPPGWSHDGSTHTSDELRALEASGNLNK